MTRAGAHELEHWIVVGVGKTSSKRMSFQLLFFAVRLPRSSGVGNSSFVLRPLLLIPAGLESWQANGSSWIPWRSIDRSRPLLAVQFFNSGRVDSCRVAYGCEWLWCQLRL